MANFMQVDSAVALAKGDFRNSEWGVYLDDTYKVTSRLTVNWGLRWEVAQPLFDKAGNEVSFQLRQPLSYIPNDPNVNLHPVYVRSGTGNLVAAEGSEPQKIWQPRNNSQRKKRVAK